MINALIELEQNPCAARPRNQRQCFADQIVKIQLGAAGIDLPVALQNRIHQGDERKAALNNGRRPHRLDQRGDTGLLAGELLGGMGVGCSVLGCQKSLLQGRVGLCEKNARIGLECGRRILNGEKIQQSFGNGQAVQLLR